MTGPPTSRPLQWATVHVAGHCGMVGAALLRRLAGEDCRVLIALRDVDLRRQDRVQRWFEDNRPDMVIPVAARVGGILANDYAPADFTPDNLIIAANVIEAARKTGIGKLPVPGSPCGALA